MQILRVRIGSQDNAIDIGGGSKRRSMFDDSADASDGGVGDKYNDNDEFQSSTSKEQDNDNVEEEGTTGGGQ